MTPGTGTSPWPCWRTPTCPSRRRPPQKPWQRPHPGHDRRGQTSPGTLNRPASRPQRSLGLVSVAQTPPAPCQSQPLPAKTGQLQRSAAGVLVTRRLPREALDRIEARCDMTLYDGEGAMPRDQLLTEVARKAGAITLLTDRVDDEFLNAAGPQLKIVANYAVGFDNIDVDACTRHGVLASNTPEVLTETTADTAFALMLAAARRIAEGDRFVRSRGSWIWGPLI